MVATAAPSSPPAATASDRPALLLVRVAGTVAIVLMIAFLVILPSKPVHENLPGLQSPMLGFELASEPEHVFGILGRPGEAVREDVVRRTDFANEIDFVFMVAYPALFVGIAWMLAARGSLSRTLLGVMIMFAVGMALGDALENRELLFLSNAADPVAMMPSLARLQRFTHVKWDAIFGASAVLALGTMQERGWFRWSSFAFGLAAVSGFAASFGYLSGIEIGMYLLAIGWIMAYVRGWQRPSTDGGPGA